MSVKQMPIYVVSILLLFLLLEIVLGKQGLLVTRHLERQLAIQEALHEEELLQLRTEQERYQRLIERDSLLDSALKLGLTEPGAKVYYFATSEEMVQNMPSKQELSVQERVFSGFPRWLLLIISWAAVSLLFLFIHLLSVRRKHDGQDY